MSAPWTPPSPTLDVGPLLDPEIAAILEVAAMDLSILSDDTVAAVRAGMAERAPVIELSDAVERTDHAIPGAADGVSVRVHRPVGVTGSLPCVYWIHGGGYVLGSNDMDDLRFDRWCPMYGCVGVSIDYRLAPETAYPGPLDDCYAGLAWAVEHAGDLGIDPDCVGIGGNSAGGGLAAGLGLLTRDRGEIDLAFQLLVYPMIDDRMITPSSTWKDPVWPPAANHYGWSSYLGALYGTDDVPAYAAAARATELAGLPPTLITVGALDGFSDEDIDYALRLRHAGVPTELHVYPGGPHGFDALAAGTAVADRARRDAEEWLAARLGRAGGR
ncbi:MAG: alpha/beta hydrolase fold domain-containing protein [Acidimicrobiales bacterium]|nr:alpha/beta hydrolase fold domain-containing protein [Acidimicrobiales bacterium]